MTIFGGFWAPFGKPLELIFGTLGVILEIQKKSRKKDPKKSGTQHPPGPARRNARIPWGGFGGVKNLQKGEEQQEAEQKEELKSEHCQVIPHAPATLPQAPGGGRIDHPQGGSTARPSFGAVPQRAVDIIWGCAVLCVLCCVCCAVSAALYVCIRGACGACVCAFAG